jgi:hypothetical protein
MSTSTTTSAFTEGELEYLAPQDATRRLGRIATVGRDGTPHVVPVGWRFNAEHDAIDVGGSTPSGSSPGGSRPIASAGATPGMSARLDR